MFLFFFLFVLLLLLLLLLVVVVVVVFVVSVYPPLPFPTVSLFVCRYRWDGTNRSNGFEERMLGAMTAGRIKASDKYKWSVSDM